MIRKDCTSCENNRGTRSIAKKFSLKLSIFMVQLYGRSMGILIKISSGFKILIFVVNSAVSVGAVI